MSCSLAMCHGRHWCCNLDRDRRSSSEKCWNLKNFELFIIKCLKISLKVKMKFSINPNKGKSNECEDS